MLSVLGPLLYCNDSNHQPASKADCTYMYRIVCDAPKGLKVSQVPDAPACYLLCKEFAVFYEEELKFVGRKAVQSKWIVL